MTARTRATWRKLKLPGRAWLLPAGDYRATVALEGLLRLLATETQIWTELRDAGLEPLSVRLTRSGFVAVVRLDQARAIDLPCEVRRLEIRQ